MARDALSYQVSDYLVKLELTPEVLKNAIGRVLTQISQSRKKQLSAVNIHPFYDKFLISLLHDLFESEEQFRLQSRDLNLNFDYGAYVCCYGEIISPQADQMSAEKQMPLFTSSLQMIRELGAKYLPLYALSLDLRHFALIFCFADSSDTDDYVESLTDILQSISGTLQNYYNVTLRCGIGIPVQTPATICDSYQYARQIFRNTESKDAIIAFDTDHSQETPRILLTSACLKMISPEPLKSMIRIFCRLQFSPSAICSGITLGTMCRLWTLPAIFSICRFPCCRMANLSYPDFLQTIRMATVPSISSPMWIT